MKCPGQDSRFWKPGAIFEVKCPECGYEVEFFKDEATRRCKNCGHKLVNPKMDFGCAAYCKFAEQCLGNLPPELIAQREDLLKDRVAIEMKKYFHRDFKRIAHARRVAKYAEEIGKEIEGTQLAPVILSAYLHELGKKDLEEGSSEDYRKLSANIAEDILKRLNAIEGLVNEVKELILRIGHIGPEDSINFKVVNDAKEIAIMEELKKDDAITDEEISEKIDKVILTDEGKKIARKALLRSG